MLLSLEARLERIMICWLLAAGLASAARIAIGFATRGPVELQAMMPYVLLTLAPVAS